jgi:hypothetical protein
MLEKLAMILAWFSQRVRLIETIKQLDVFKGANLEASVKGLPALRGTSDHSKKGEKINLRRLLFFYQLHLAAACAALYREKGRRRAPQRH